MGATEKIARFIVDTSYEDIPRDAIEKAERTALDCLGAALAGVVEKEKGSSPLLAHKQGAQGQANLIDLFLG